MKYVDTSVLRIGYEEWNPDAARTVVLLHGWPDSPRTWAQVAPVLALQGWRVIVPALRIYANTMKWANIDEIHVPKIGLADGLINHLYEQVK